MSPLEVRIICACGREFSSTALWEYHVVTEIGEAYKDPILLLPAVDALHAHGTHRVMVK